MARLPVPPPPSDLATVSPRWHVLDSRTELWRIYPRGGPYPSSWNSFCSHGPSTRARFDHHNLPVGDQERAILYAATQILTCIAEVFQDTRVIDPQRSEPWLVGFRLARPVRLLSLRGVWPTRAGASMALNTGERSRAREWSRAIYEAHTEVEGLWYASAMNASAPAVALYERAADAPETPPIFHRALANPLMYSTLAQAAHIFRYGLGI